MTSSSIISSPKDRAPRVQRAASGRHRASRIWARTAEHTVAFLWARVSDLHKAAGRPPLDPERAAHLLGRRQHEPLHCKVNRSQDTQVFAPLMAA